MNDKKEFSARKFMAVFFSAVYGIIMIVLTYAFTLKLINTETYIALLGAFALIVKEIVNDYFDRDRTKDQPNGGAK
jgi:1,4-dihydroxy-2-naphthoate octaprenyltransferase